MALKGPVVQHLLKVHGEVLNIVVAQNLALEGRDKDVPLGVNALRSVVVLKGGIQAFGVKARDGLVHHELGVLVDGYVPAGSEEQPVVPHYPDVLVLQRAGVVVSDAPALGDIRKLVCKWTNCSLVQ